MFRFSYFYFYFYRLKYAHLKILIIKMLHVLFMIVFPTGEILIFLLANKNQHHYFKAKYILVRENQKKNAYKDRHTFCMNECCNASQFLKNPVNKISIQQTSPNWDSREMNAQRMRLIWYFLQHLTSDQRWCIYQDNSKATAWCFLGIVSFLWERRDLLSLDLDEPEADGGRTSPVVPQMRWMQALPALPVN